MENHQTTVRCIAMVCVIAGASVLSTRPASAAPQSIPLISGYKHEPGTSLDTKVGTLSKDGGPTIHYDIGDNAGNHARVYAERNPKAWTVAQDSTIITMDESRDVLVVTVANVANFEGRNIRTRRDMAEMLAMVLSYDLM